jgi:hypothetical protein
MLVVLWRHPAVAVDAGAPLLLGWACSRNTVQCEMFGLLFMLVNKYLRISDPNLIPTGRGEGVGGGGEISLYLLRMCTTTNGLN